MIRVVRGDLADSRADGILRPVNASGEAVSAAGVRIEEVVGTGMAERLRDIGEVPVGGATITPGWTLHASYVIHVVVQSPVEVASELTVRLALLNGLRRANDWDLRSLALAPLGVGPGNLETERSAAVLIDVLEEHVRSGLEPQSLDIVVESEYEEGVFRRLVEAAAGGTPDQSEE